MDLLNLLFLYENPNGWAFKCVAGKRALLSALLSLHNHHFHWTERIWEYYLEHASLWFWFWRPVFSHFVVTCFLQEVGQRTQCVFKSPQREYPKKLRALWRPLWANWVDFMFCQNNVYAGFCFNIKKTEPAISSPKLLVILEISACGADNNAQPWRPTRCDKSNTCTYNNLLDIDDISIPTSIALQVTVCK